MVITNEQYVLAIGRAGLTYADGVLSVARKDVSGCSPDWGKYACWLKEIKAAQYFLSLDDYTSTDAIYFYNEMLRIAEMNHINPTIDPTAQPVGGIVITPTGSGIYVDLISNQNNINGFKGFLKPVTVPDGTAPTHAVNLSQLDAKAPVGLKNQIQYVTSDDTNDYYTDNNMVSGQFISTDDELTRALTRGSEAQQTIFNTWKRFSHITGLGIPSIPLETNEWVYNAGTNAINLTANTNSYTGFISNNGYENFVLSTTFSSIVPTDDDNVAVVIAYIEDIDDQVPNLAYGLNPDDFTWPIDTTSITIPNQHTISLIRGRNSTITQHYILVYDYDRPTQRVLRNGSSLVANIVADWGTNTVDVKAVLNNGVITTYTTEMSDAPGGKGILRFPLTYDLKTDTELSKFLGKVKYGYAALSQNGATFSSTVFSGDENVIYDLRNGDTYVYSDSGYIIDATRNFFTEVGVERFLYNPYEFIIFYVQRDGNIIVSGTASITASNGLTTAGSNIKLGGVLTENTTIGVTTKGLSITGQDADYLLTGSFKFDDGHGGVNPAIRLLLNGPLGSGGLTIIDGATTIGGVGEAINFNVNGTIFTSNANQWAKYILDYSEFGSLDDRSIPDLGYVKSLVSGSKIILNKTQANLSDAGGGNWYMPFLGNSNEALGTDIVPVMTLSDNVQVNTIFDKSTTPPRLYGFGSNDAQTIKVYII